MTPVIHYSDWASQPDVHLACGATADLWAVPFTPERFMQDGGPTPEELGYTFITSRVTCPACRAWLDAASLTPTGRSAP